MKVFRNPLFYLTLVLAGALVFQIAQFVQGQTTGIWQPPTVSPPGGQPEAPLDTGTSPQTKKGPLTLTDNFIIKNRNEFVGFNWATKNILFSASEGTKEAGIRFAPDSDGTWKLQASNNRRDINSWFTLGAGTGGAGGGGESLWKSVLLVGTSAGIAPAGPKTIYYDGRVGVGTESSEYPIAYGMLQVNGTGYSEGVTVVNSNGQTGRMWMDSDNNLFLTRSDDASRGIVIDHNGAIGIGVKPINLYGKVQINIGKGGASAGYTHGLALWNGASANTMLRIWLDEYGGSHNDIVFTRGIPVGGSTGLYNSFRIDGKGNISFEGMVKRLQLGDLSSASKPVCGETNRGLLWYEQPGADVGGKDNLSICTARQVCDYIDDGERWQQTTDIISRHTFWEKGINCRNMVGSIWNCEEWVRTERLRACPVEGYKWVQIAEY